MHPLHNFLEPIRHIIFIKFQSVYPLLYYAKLKLYCTGLRQTQHGVYNHVELFFACCDIVNPLHNFLDPIRHIISIVSTHFCTTRNSNFSAQVYGKHNMVFTIM